MDLTFLGTASAYPTPARGVSCIIYRNEGTYWMFDCGEGSQIQLMKSTIRPGKISKIFITHLHGDHLFGLPGLMCTASQGCTETSEPLVLYGPVGLRKFLQTSLLLSQSMLGFDYIVHEMVPAEEQLTDTLLGYPDYHTSDERLHPNELAEGTTIRADKEGVWHIYEDETHIVKASWLRHKIPSFGFAIQEKPLPGRLDPSILKAKGVPPGPLYAKIKAGESITTPNGETLHPSDVTGPPRPGRLVGLLGDSSDSQMMAALCQGADVIVHEATLEDGKEENAIEKGHSTPGMAGRFAKCVEAKSLVLTHFSQRYKSIARAEQNSSSEDSSVAILIQQAEEAFGSNKVAAADDLMTIAITQRPI